MALCFGRILIGQSGPWIAITGVRLPVRVAWTTRQISLSANSSALKRAGRVCHSAGAALFQQPTATEREHHLSAYNRRNSRRQLQAAKEDVQRLEIVRNRPFWIKQKYGRDVQQGGHENWMAAGGELVEGLIPN